MNIPNNKRKKESQEKIKKAFIEMIQTKEINQISVTDIVKNARVNRSTFYVSYLDVYDLADKIKEEMFDNLLILYKEQAIKREHSYNYLTLFKHIKENQIYYKTLFRLNYDFGEHYDTEMEKQEAIKYLGTTDNMEYHVEFFKAGINAIIKKWLFNGCIESPEEINAILNIEYKGRIIKD